MDYKEPLTLEDVLQKIEFYTHRLARLQDIKEDVEIQSIASDVDLTDYHEAILHFIVISNTRLRVLYRKLFEHLSATTAEDQTANDKDYIQQ